MAPSLVILDWGVSLEHYLPKIGNTIVCNISIETKSAIENIEAICCDMAKVITAPILLSNAEHSHSPRLFHRVISWSLLAKQWES